MSKKYIYLTFFWICLAFIFDFFIYHYLGKEKALQFLVGYILEKGLSIDNLLVFFVIFATLRIPVEYQPKVLSLGVLGALFFRLIFIWGGVTLLSYAHWVIYLFAIFFTLYRRCFNY